jgi:hypothetical protein
LLGIGILTAEDDSAIGEYAVDIQYDELDTL